MTKKIAKEKSDRKDSSELKQSRNWCFTDFTLTNYSDIYHKYSDIIRYICWGEETCPSTKKIHHQGWIQFTTKRTMGGVKRILKIKGIHLESCYGDEYSNDKYCKKDNKFKQFGKFITQGERTDLEHVKKFINEGHSLKEIADENFDLFCRYRSGLTKYKEMVDKENSKQFRNVDVQVLYGPTGCGKTRQAMAEATFKIEGGNLKWWDGYEADKCILIDEFANQIPITELLNILDGYQLRLPIKGGHTYALWSKVFITTNLSFEDWYPNAKTMHKEALLRRISRFAEVTPTGNTITVGVTELRKKIQQYNIVD